MGRLVSVCEQTGRQHDGVHRGKEDRPARRERVRGGAGRGRDDEAVGAVGGGVPTLDGHGQVDDAAHRRLDDDDVVEGDVLGQPLAAPANPRGAGSSAPRWSSGPPATPPGRQSSRRSVVAVRKPRPPRFTPRIGHPEIAHGAGHGEQRAVAAEHDEQVDLARKLLPADGGDCGSWAQGLPSPCRAPPPRPRAGEPVEEAARRRRRLAARPAWRRCRRASRQRLDALLDDRLEFAGRPPVRRQVQEELPVALGAAQRRGASPRARASREGRRSGPGARPPPGAGRGRARPRPCRRRRARPRTGA